MENEMIERVASGMLGCPVQNLPNKEDRAYWRRNARAAIEAMREPTEAMQDAMDGTGEYGGIADGGGIESDNFDPLTVYQAAIDAALSPP